MVTEFIQKGVQAHKKKYAQAEKQIMPGIVINSHYDNHRTWAIKIDNYAIVMLISGPQTRFAIKHLIFEGDQDQQKLDNSGFNPENYLREKAKRRMLKRNTAKPDPFDGIQPPGSISRNNFENALRLERKYKTGPTPTTCMVNMKNLPGIPYILPEAAAEKIANAIKNSEKISNRFDVIIDFGINCVVTVSNIDRVRFGCSMKISGEYQNGYTMGKGGAVILDHAVTTGLPLQDNII